MGTENMSLGKPGRDHISETGQQRSSSAPGLSQRRYCNTLLPWIGFGGLATLNKISAIIIPIIFLCLSLSTSPDSLAGNFHGEDELLENISLEERQNYNALQYIMNRYQKKQYLTLPTRKERDAWIERFWIDLDPTPTTKRNERRTEHDTRASLARELFPKQESPGWDGRGEIYIRFGRPDSTVQTLGHMGYYNVRMPGEVWYYNSLGMIISFEDECLTGEFTYYKKVFHMTGRQLQAFQEGFKPVILPQYIDPLQESNLGASNPDKIEDFVAGMQVRDIHEQTLITDVGDEHYQADKAANRFYKYMKEKPFVHSCELRQNPLPVYFDVTTFKGGPGKLRTDVNIEVPTSEIRFKPKRGRREADVVFRVLARDAQMNEVVSARDVIKATAAAGMEAGEYPSHMPGQVTLTLEPGYYRIGVEAIDKHSGNRGAYRTNVYLESLDDSLELSDILFASKINEAVDNPRFAKGNLQVIPHPLHLYKIPYPLTFYFEIYGLDTDGEGFTFYTVEYEILPLEKRRRGPVLENVTTAVSSKFRTSGLGSKQVQRLEIATDELWKGPFRLIVTVTDRRTYGIAKKSTKFYLLD